MAGVYHQQRVGQAARAKRLLGAAQHHQRILAAGKQQRRALERGGHLAQDEDGFFFQGIEMVVAELAQHMGCDGGVHAKPKGKYRERAGLQAALTCRPHSLAVSSSHHQRPARKSSPRLMARVQGAQPTEG
ncbi:hypothetical protein D3C71_1758560 [compost metagenome]